MNAMTYGPKVAKHVFQMYWVGAQTGDIANRRFRRDELISFSARPSTGRVALVACGMRTQVGPQDQGTRT